MLFVDPRVGSREYAPLIAGCGTPVEVAHLDFGDFAFAGNGPKGNAVSIGVELKKLPDLLQSFASGRLQNHQLPGLCGEFDHAWLVVEGRYRPGPSGVLEWAKERPWKDATICNWEDAGYGMRRWMYRELEGRLTTLQLRANIHLKHTANKDETTRFIASLYDWWTSGEYEEHRSHMADVMKMQGAGLRPPTLKERVAAQLPHLGGKMAAMAAGHFDSVRTMVNASEQDWIVLPRIGKKVARDIVIAVGGVAA